VLVADTANGELEDLLNCSLDRSVALPIIMMWDKLILSEGVASIPMLLLALVYFRMIDYPNGARVRVVCMCMCSLCPVLLTVARQLIALCRLRPQQQICRWLGTQRISSGLALWYFMCIVLLCMIDKTVEAACYIFLFAANLLIAVESHLCLPRQWLVEQGLVEQEAQVQVVLPREKYTTSMSCTTCLICLEDFEEEISTVARLPCDHIFHADCAENWLRHNNRCPLRCMVKPAGNQLDQHAPTATDGEHLEVEHLEDRVWI